MAKRFKYTIYFHLAEEFKAVWRAPMYKKKINAKNEDDAIEKFRKEFPEDIAVIMDVR